MEIVQYNLYATDADNPAHSCKVMRIERVATKKKPHAILEAYCEKRDADILIAIRYLDWWTLEQVPSFMIPTNALQSLFDAEKIRLDFIP